MASAAVGLAPPLFEAAATLGKVDARKGRCLRVTQRSPAGNSGGGSEERWERPGQREAPRRLGSIAWCGPGIPGSATSPQSDRAGSQSASPSHTRSAGPRGRGSEGGQLPARRPRGQVEGPDPRQPSLPVLPAPGRSRSQPRALVAPHSMTSRRPVGSRPDRQGASARAEGPRELKRGSVRAPAAGLRYPCRCRELSLGLRRARAPWTPLASTRWCARCATCSTSARVFWTASMTSVPAAFVASRPTAASCAHCANTRLW
ncbi:translation initiation factor IF-2-like [Cebus imitator]|uniref:translation initiation factor IF-2-like n=1 Tax=Cebus imitator TaxID=2715852 RepID=UPI001897C7C0|nr:translation initiation factor IF-2-like [Cebus imitator]